MFGSLIATRAIYAALSGNPAITNVVGNSIHSTTIVPSGASLPAIIFYMAQSTYGGAVGTELAEHIDSETVRFEVRAICKGTSSAPIEPVAYAQLEELAGSSHDIVVAGVSYLVSFTALGETALNTLIDGANVYKQLGTVYSIDMTRGG